MIPELGSQGGFSIEVRYGGVASNTISVPYRPAFTGDPRTDFDHSAQVEEVNQWLIREVAHPDAIARYYHQGEESALKPKIVDEIARLRGLNRDYILANQNPLAASNIETTRSFIQAADQQTEGLSIIERASARLAKFSKWHHLFDLDNTLTQYDGRSTIQVFRQLFPASKWAEEMLSGCAPDREIFNVLHAASWQPALRNRPDLFEEAATKIPVRSGADEYFGVLKANAGKHDVTILSGSFEPFVRRSLQQIPNADGSTVLAVPVDGPTITSIEKGAVIQQLVARDPGEGIIYYGDGESDITALNARDQIALFFVLRGGSFHRAAAEAGVLHVPFGDFEEVRQTMAAIQAA